MNSYSFVQHDPSRAGGGGGGGGGGANTSKAAAADAGDEGLAVDDGAVSPIFHSRRLFGLSDDVAPAVDAHPQNSFPGFRVRVSRMNEGDAVR